MSTLVNLTLYVELVRSEKWPFISTGRTWVRAPKNVSTPVIKINLAVPRNLFDLLMTVHIDIPDRPADVEGEATWTQP